MKYIVFDTNDKQNVINLSSAMWEVLSAGSNYVTNMLYDVNGFSPNFFMKVTEETINLGSSENLSNIRDCLKLCYGRERSSEIDDHFAYLETIDPVINVSLFLPETMSDKILSFEQMTTNGLIAINEV